MRTRSSLPLNTATFCPGHAQGWPIDTEEGISQRVFGHHQAFTENLLIDLAEELKTSSTNYTLTDLRGSGYYGLYHALLITQALKPSALPVALAKAVTNVIPMIFIQLIADDMRADQTTAARVLKLSRLYGERSTLVTFKMLILARLSEEDRKLSTYQRSRT
ncbi:hypothetical protein OC835_006242, partial [Tilletia horrida]